MGYVLYAPFSFFHSSAQCDFPLSWGEKRTRGFRIRVPRRRSWFSWSISSSACRTGAGTSSSLNILLRGIGSAAWGILGVVACWGASGEAWSGGSGVLACGPCSWCGLCYYHLHTNTNISLTLVIAINSATSGVASVFMHCHQRIYNNKKIICINNLAPSCELKSKMTFFLSRKHHL